MDEQVKRRVEQLQDRWGLRLPADYQTFLSETARGASDVIDPAFRAVRSLFELSDGPAFLQLDEVMRLVGDVIPPDTVPIADDEAGNFYLLDCSGGPGHGRVLWWDHERELGDHHTELIEPTFQAFIAAIPMKV